MTEPNAASEARRQLIERLRRSDLQTVSVAAQPLILRSPDAPAPLSPSQKQVWFHSQLAAGVPAYNEGVTIHKWGPLDPVVLERCFNEIVRRHDIWRSAFLLHDGKLIQRIDSNVRVHLPFDDLSHLPAEEREAEAIRIASADVQRRFDPSLAPLFRLRLVRLAENYHRIYLTLHHLVFDGVSIYRVLIRELAALYNAYSARQISPLPELAVQYGDYALWQDQQLANGSHAGQLKYWRDALSGELPMLELPTDRPRPAQPTWRGGMETCTIAAPLIDAVKELSRSEGATPYMTLLAAFQVLLYRYSGQDEIVVGGATNMRNRPDFEPLIGYFLNTVVYRSHVGADVSFREFLGRVKNTVIGALAHSDIPFDAVVRELAPQRDTGRHPLFQVLFSMRPPFTDFPDGWDVTDMEVHSGTSTFDLFVEFSEHPHGLAGRFVYSTDLFDRPTIQRLSANFQVLLKELLANPDQAVSRVPLLADEERNTLLVDWNATHKDFPKLHIHELFEARQEAQPDHPALIFRGRKFSYAELNVRSNKLAHYLREKGAGRGTLVGIYMERSFEMVVALLAVLKSGAAYVPYDPEVPQSRLGMMLADSQPVCVLTQQQLIGNLAEYGGEKIVLDAPCEGVEGQSGANLGIAIAPGDAIYAIYTSGSTGVPKAAINTHQAVANRILWMQDEYPIQANDRILQKTPYTFDVSVWEFFWPLACGATLVIAEPGGHRDPSYLANLIHTRADHDDSFRAFHAAGVSGARKPRPLRFAAPRFLERGSIASRCDGKSFFSALRRSCTICTGLPKRRWMLRIGTAPNEAPCVTVPIGRPISNVKAYILDRNLAPVPIGVAGELHIGGVALASGYLNRPQLTAERFIADPFSDDPSARLYKTGDRTRFLADGNIEYLGRLDNQVKLRGYRIEVGEIESAILQWDQVQAAIVVMREDSTIGKHLVGYIVPAASGLDARAIRTFLKERLPDYMIPSHFVFLESMPLLSNGKVNRSALPMPQHCPQATREEYVAPDDAIERQLVAIWEALLGTHPIGVNHDFFDLGGHSLLALELLSGIKLQFEVELPLATLFYAPTIRTLAALIRDSEARAVDSPIVPIQPNGTKPAIYCIGALGGEVMLFRRLSQLLGQDQPLYGLQPFSLGERLSTVESIAAGYLAELRQWGEPRPFALLGYSFGGLVAIEMARQLRKNGNEPAVTAIIDARYLAGCKAVEPIKARIHRYLYHLDQSIRGPRGIGYLVDRFRYSFLRRVRKVSEGLGVELLKTATDIVGRQMIAAESYRPKPYSGRIYMFRAESRTELLDDQTMGWGKILLDLQIDDVPGDHGTINTGENVRVLAGKLMKILKNAANGQDVERDGAARRLSANSLHQSEHVWR